MNILDRLRRFFQSPEEEKEEVLYTTQEQKESNIDFTLPVSPEEKELVSVIASAILAGSHPDSHIQVKSVKRIDKEKEIAAVIAAAIAAGDRPESTFVLKSIEKTDK